MGSLPVIDLKRKNSRSCIQAITVHHMGGIEKCDTTFNREKEFFPENCRRGGQFSPYFMGAS
jgi:hypothetical protein